MRLAVSVRLTGVEARELVGRLVEVADLIGNRTGLTRV